MKTICEKNGTKEGALRQDRAHTEVSICLIFLGETTQMHVDKDEDDER